MKSLLDKLHLTEVNPGACSGPDGWISDPQAKKLVSYNPATGEAIAAVAAASGVAYETMLRRAAEGFQSWQNVPAPKRGAVVRDLGNLLREYKEPLGELVSLEMGKIRPEGLGEVQEMIDTCWSNDLPLAQGIKFGD
jgi:aldehyde dehydrogenase (NAD+)